MQLFLTSEAKAEKMRHLRHIVKSENKSLNFMSNYEQNWTLFAGNELRKFYAIPIRYFFL